MTRNLNDLADVFAARDAAKAAELAAQRAAETAETTDDAESKAAAARLYDAWRNAWADYQDSLARSRR